MAIPALTITGTPGLTEIDDADVDTTWTGFNEGAGGAPAPADDSGVFIEGAAAIATKISGSSQNKGLWFDATTGVDMTATNRHLFIWFQCTTPAILNTIANGGIYIKIASDASGNNWNKYYMDGSDTYPGGWVRYVLDCNLQASETAATAATLTSIRWFGMGVKLTGTSKSENIFVDAMHYGEGVTLTGGDATTPHNWEEAYLLDVATPLGIIQKDGSTYKLKGAISIGDAASTTTTVWIDESNAKVEWSGSVYHNGWGVVPSFSEGNFYTLDIQGNSTGTTDVRFGKVIGTGDDRQGILGGSIYSVSTRWQIDAETDIADLDTVNFYGCTFEFMGVGKYSGSTKTDIIGCQFIDCAEQQINDVECLNNVFIAPTPSSAVEIVPTTQIKQCNFIAAEVQNEPLDRVWRVDVSVPVANDDTANANSAATGDWTMIPPTEAIADYTAFGVQKYFGGLELNINTAGVGGVVVWEYYGTGGWTALAGVTDGTTSLTVSGTNDVTWTIPIQDWIPVSLAGRLAFYVRFRITTVYSTNPVGSQAFIIDVVEQHLKCIDATLANGYTAEALKFFGFGAAGAFKYHGVAWENATTTTAGSFTTNQWYEILTVGSTDFTAVGASANTVGIQFKATGAGSGTGTAYELLYFNNTEDSTLLDTEFDAVGTPAAPVLVNQPQIDTIVHILDGRDNVTDLENVRVILEASDATGDLPFDDTVTITRTGSVASVAHTAHGMVNGNQVKITGAVQDEYNGSKTITNVTTNAYDFTVSGTPTSPATGTIKATGILLEGLTDSSGLISDSRSWVSAQPVVGVARLSTTSPFFRDGPLTGTVSTTLGLTITQALVFDE